MLAETDDRGCGVFSVYEIATGARVLGPVIPPFGLGDVAMSPTARSSPSSAARTETSPSTAPPTASCSARSPGFPDPMV